MTTTTVFVSIGRNVGNKPLPAKKWQAFQWRTGAILAHVAPILAKFTGQGTWEGQTEETAGWLVSFPSLQQAEETRAFLHLVASECYGQESVGFTVHGANPWPNSYTGDD